MSFVGTTTVPARWAQRFGVFLIFHKESGQARVFHGSDGVGGLQGAAVAGVGVGKDGNGDGGGDAAGLAYDIFAGQQADVRQAECGGRDG